MSEFGDSTPKQEMLDCVKTVKEKHNMSWFDFLLTLTEILVYLISVTNIETGDEK